MRSALERISCGGGKAGAAWLRWQQSAARFCYNVLAIDLRGHGESGGQFISPGLVERRDLLGAIRYLRSRGERGPIALMGVCLGGVASLFTAALPPATDSATTSCTTRR